MACRVLTNKLTNTSNLGGPYTGYSPQQTIVNYKDSSQVMIRKVLRRGWNNETYDSSKRIITPFRSVNNLGDYSARRNYICGGPNQISPGYRKGRIGSIISNCDNSKVPSSTCNVKFVADSSDYTTYRKQMACVKNYNDLRYGGKK